jgi:hypothetical protein
MQITSLALTDASTAIVFGSNAAPASMCQHFNGLSQLRELEISVDTSEPVISRAAALELLIALPIGIRRLDIALGAFELDVDCMTALQRLPHLLELKLRLFRSGHMTMGAFDALSKLTSLVFLEISGSGLPLNSLIVSQLRNSLPHLAYFQHSG